MSDLNGRVPWWRRLMFVGAGLMIVWIAAWFMEEMEGVVDSVNAIDAPTVAPIVGALTVGVSVIFAALLILFFLLAIGTYGKERLSSLVEGGKETIGRFVSRDDK